MQNWGSFWCISLLALLLGVRNDSAYLQHPIAFILEHDENMEVLDQYIWRWDGET